MRHEGGFCCGAWRVCGKSLMRLMLLDPSGLWLVLLQWMMLEYLNISLGHSAGRAQCLICVGHLQFVSQGSVLN